jgi:hypothetical protein
MLVQFKSVYEPQEGLNTKNDCLSNGQFKVHLIFDQSCTVDRLSGG